VLPTRLGLGVLRVGTLSRLDLDTRLGLVSGRLVLDSLARLEPLLARAAELLEKPEASRRS